MVSVKVGNYLEDGTFDGEEIEFEGREVDRSEGVAESLDPHDVFSVTLRLYKCPDGYRVHEFLSSLLPDQESETSLYPVVGYLGYGTYAEDEVQEKWGRHFKSLGS